MFQPSGPSSNSSSMPSLACPRQSSARFRRCSPPSSPSTPRPQDRRPQPPPDPLSAAQTRHWQHGAPSGTEHHRAPRRSLLAALHTGRTAAALPLRPYPSQSTACCRVQHQPIDPPRKHPIRAQTAAGRSALRADLITCYKTQISLQQTTASRCSVCNPEGLMS